MFLFYFRCGMYYQVLNLSVLHYTGVQTFVSLQYNFISYTCASAVK